MYIQFYGHSITSKDPKIKTFVDQILDYYDCQTSHNDSYIGIALCSEERILRMVKKTKNLDLAIIFHSHPSLYYVPFFPRDFQHMSDEDIKINAEGNRHWSVTPDEMYNILKISNDNLYDVEVQRNRFIGSLMQIDSYLKNLNIKSIHVFIEKDHVPKWFTLTSGIIDYEISMIQKVEHQNYVGYNKSKNAIDQEGNDKIFHMIKNYINLL